LSGQITENIFAAPHVERCILLKERHGIRLYSHNAGLCHIIDFSQKYVILIYRQISSAAYVANLNAKAGKSYGKRQNIDSG
jgi:hypothetical protein